MAKIPNGLLFYIQYILHVHYTGQMIRTCIAYVMYYIIYTDSQSLFKPSADVFECLCHGSPFVIHLPSVLLQLLLGMSQLMGQLHELLTSLNQIEQHTHWNSLF